MILQPFLIERDDAPDLQFVGQVIGAGFSYVPVIDTIRRGTMARLFRTEGDNWIAEIVEFEEFAGTRHTLRSSAAVASKPEDLVQFFGNGRAAKALYASVGSILPRPFETVE